MKKMYFFLVALFCVLINPALNAQSADALEAALISSSDVDVTIVNDATYPWVPSADTTHITNGNLGHAYTSSTISISYTSERVIEFKVDWACYGNSNTHLLELYIDGVRKGSTANNSYTTPRYYLPAGEHVITFRDTMHNTTQDHYNSRIKNLRIREIHPAEVVDFVSYSDVDITLSHDTLYPWVYDSANGCITNENIGFANTSSTITISYASNKMTEFKADWYCYGDKYHVLELYIDGVRKESTTSTSNTTPRYYLPAGEHVITFRDTMHNTTYEYYYSRIKNLSIREILPLEEVVLSPNSQPLTFNNTDRYAWTTEDGYIQNGNYGKAKSSSKFSTTFTIDEISMFSYEWYLSYPYHQVICQIQADDNTNTIEHSYNDNSWKKHYEILYPGTYTITFKDTSSNTEEYFSRLRNIELTQDWVEVELEYAGTLGVEVLYQVDVLNDVLLLKVKGTLNDTDWGYIKQMNNIVGLDLSEATFNVVPKEMFMDKVNFSYIKLPDGITQINNSAFRNTKIRKIDIPTTVETIEDYVFDGCELLESIVIPDNVKNLGGSVFHNCKSLTSIHFSDALTEIPTYCCNYCTSLKEVILPSNLRTIKYESFSYSGLKRLDFPESLRTIESYCFRNVQIDSIKLPLLLSSLSSDAFYGCGVKYIELPSYIGNYDENFYYCQNINKVVCKSATPPGITSDPFRNGPAKSNITLVVPSFAVAAYKLDSYWYQFGTIEEGEPLDYWKITGDLMLTNNRRMEGTPDIQIATNGRLTVAGAAPFPSNYFLLDVSASSTSALLNNCKAMYADSIDNSYYLDEANKWYFIVPLYDVDLKRVYHTGGAPFVFRYYDAANRASNGTGGSWKNVTDSVLRHSQGYIVRSNAANWIHLPAVDSLSASQIFCTEDVTIPLNAQVSDNTANAHWNYVGNPYPCYYDIWYMDFPAPITVWTGSTYKAYSLADDNYALRPMQAFFVQKPDEISEITFHKEGRQVNSDITHTANAPQRRNAVGTQRNVFNITITATNGMSDDTRVVINEQAQRTYEIHCDASKFMSMDAACPQIYTLDDQSTPLAINERPRHEGVVRAGFYAAAAGEYTITAAGAEGILIRDLDRQITHNLEVADYRFTVTEAGLCDTRFEFIFTEKQPVVTDIEDTYAALQISNQNGVLTIKNAPADVLIYTVDGRLIEHAAADNTIHFTLQPGVYVVQVGNVMSKQIIH